MVVVGAGLAGLSAALWLAGRGRQVTIVERATVPGGRAGRLDQSGYAIDTGPTVLTMPEIIDETLAAVGDSLGQRLDLLRLDPAYTARFADGSVLPVHTEADAMAEAVRAFAGSAQAAGYRKLRAWLHQLYEVEFDTFIAANFDSPLGLLTPALAKLAALGGFRRLDRAVRRFITDERLRRVFSFQALYAGQAPQRALALYGVISYMDTVAGVYFPRGGIRALPDALAAAATRAGVVQHYRQRVSALERSGDTVRAVHTADGMRLECDAVVLSTELYTAYRLLGRAPRRLVRLRASPSAVVLHCGVPRLREQVPHHNILFGAEWERTFTEIIRTGTLMSDPSLLVTRPTATDPSLAPAGRDLLQVLAPAPNLDRGRLDWSRITRPYTDELLSVVRERLLPELGAGTELLDVTTPQHWAAQGMRAGSPFALAHTFFQTGPFRPANAPAGAGNVVLAGSSTVPGVGVPTALISGRLAADRITG